MHDMYMKAMVMFGLSFRRRRRIKNIRFTDDLAVVVVTKYPEKLMGTVTAVRTWLEKAG